jgi:DNA-binding PadR family transcriptional regulator
MHPYEMHQLIRDRGTDYAIKVRAGSLYHTVQRLHRHAFIGPVETGREGRRPERTVYAITDAGRDEFMSNLRDLLRFPAEEFPVFASALEMLGAVEPATARRLLEHRAIALEAELAGIEQVMSSLTKNGLGRIALVENEYVQCMCRAELAWVRQVIADIGTGDLSWSSRCTTDAGQLVDPPASGRAAGRALDDSTAGPSPHKRGARTRPDDASAAPTSFATARLRSARRRPTTDKEFTR